jgi:hypothetical protein
VAAGFVLIGTVVVIAAGAILVLPIKMQIVEDRATKVANSLSPFANGSPVCTSAASAVSVVGSLMTAKRVCVVGQRLPHFSSTYIVEFEPGIADAPYNKENVQVGLLFAPVGVDDNFQGPQISLPCVRHPVGDRWVYVAGFSWQDANACPATYLVPPHVS